VPGFRLDRGFHVSWANLTDHLNINIDSYGSNAADLFWKSARTISSPRFCVGHDRRFGLLDAKMLLTVVIAGGIVVC
jgi:hypothetical protein